MANNGADHTYIAIHITYAPIFQYFSTLRRESRSPANGAASHISYTIHEAERLMNVDDEVVVTTDGPTNGAPEIKREFV